MSQINEDGAVCRPRPGRLAQSGQGVDKGVSRACRCQLGYGGARGEGRAHGMEKGRKSTQRQRLISGVIEAANRGGYSRAPT